MFISGCTLDGISIKKIITLLLTKQIALLDLSPVLYRALLKNPSHLSKCFCPLKWFLFTRAEQTELWNDFSYGFSATSFAEGHMLNLYFASELSTFSGIDCQSFFDKGGESL